MRFNKEKYSPSNYERIKYRRNQLLAKIHCKAKEYGMNNNHMLSVVTQVLGYEPETSPDHPTGLSKCNINQLTDVINILIRLKPRLPNGATWKQEYKILCMVRDMIAVSPQFAPWLESKGQKLASPFWRWAQKWFGVRGLQLTKFQAGRIIDVLEGMIERAKSSKQETELRETKERLRRAVEGMRGSVNA